MLLQSAPKGNGFPKSVYKLTRSAGAKVKWNRRSECVNKAIYSWWFTWSEKHGKEPDDWSVENERDASA